MRSRRVFASVAVVATFAASLAAVAPGCKDATQATLEIRMAKTDLCPKLGGTAIAVGSDRNEVETRVSTYVTAETRDCDVASGSIGSLVVTPGDVGRSAIIVAVAFDTSRARTATDCKPPAYAGCVVARRYFAFSDHTNLRIPITIDPECLDVPCNATSTCRKGNCYDSETSDGLEPGDDGAGGASEAGIVDGAVDGFVPDGSKPDGSSDGAVEGGDSGRSDADAEEGEGGPPPLAQCIANILNCNRDGSLGECSGSIAQACCDLDVPNRCSTPAACGAKTKYCCVPADCTTAGETCMGANGTTPGRCLPSGVAPPTCGGGAGPLLCPSPTVCNGAALACCSARGMPATCQAGPSCVAKGDDQWCCQQSDCPATKLCPAGVGNVARICTGGVDSN